MNRSRVNKGFAKLQTFGNKDKLVVSGYLREQQRKLFTVECNNSFFNLQSVRSVILIFFGHNNKTKLDVKVAVVGDSNSGATTLIVKYIEDKFDEEYMSTVGINIMEKSFELSNCIANLQLYDLGGQRQFAGLMPTALEGTKAVIFTFNLMQKQSLISIKRWYKDARKLNKVFKPILVGTKYDLFQQKDSVFKLEICKMARGYAENMRSPFIMCSSYANKHVNVKQVFTIVVGSVFQIRIKSKQKHDKNNEPILEYDIIYNKHNKKKAKKDKKKKKKKKKNKKKSGNDDLIIKEYYCDS